MSDEPTAAPSPKKLPVVDQVSAGGVAYRRGPDGIEVALISVGPQARWQLPKGLVDPGESPEITAVREVREEAGIETDLIEPLDTIEYWYVGWRGKQRVRFHKRVHCFLLAYRSGDVRDHDREVNEARWVPLADAQTMLAFKGERAVVAQAAERLRASAADA
jgi:8-oxo-dGTP pyrophosphatase MutT (NUDIX family)